MSRHQRTDRPALLASILEKTGSSEEELAGVGTGAASMASGSLLECVSPIDLSVLASVRTATVQDCQG